MYMSTHVYKCMLFTLWRFSFAFCLISFVVFYLLTNTIPNSDLATLQHALRCNVAAGREKITRPKYDQEGVVPFVVDAVYAMAHALQAMIRVECAGSNFCDAVNPPEGKALLAYIRNVSFIGRRRVEKLYSFDVSFIG